MEFHLNDQFVEVRDYKISELGSHAVWGKTEKHDSLKMEGQNCKKCKVKIFQ